MKKLTNESPMLDWALYYATEVGIPVFPIMPKTKDKYFPDYEHLGRPTRSFPEGTPYSWQSQATTDVDRIKKYWGEHPDANIGGVTGGQYFVVDVDIKNGRSGYDSITKWEGEGTLPGNFNPNTWHSITGKCNAEGNTECGQYFYFLPQEFEGDEDYKDLVGSANMIDDNSLVDTRGFGRYVVLPPSVHPNGHKYVWEESRNPQDSDVAELDSVVEYIFRHPYVKNKAKGEAIGHTFEGELIQHGGRRDYLVSKVGQLVAKSGNVLSDEAILEAVMQIARTELSQDPPIDYDELRDDMKAVIYSFKENGIQEEGVNWSACLKAYKKDHGGIVPDPVPWDDVKTYQDKINTASDSDIKTEAKTDTQPNPKTEGDQEELLKVLNGWNIDDLLQADIKKPMFGVQDVIPQGLTIIASPPKYGKTWLGLDMCIQVARGGQFLGFDTTRGSALYFDLETYPGAMKERLQLLLEGQTPPKGLTINFKEQTKTMKDGFIEQLTIFKKEHPDLKLVVIDVLQKIKYPTTKNESMYDTEYRTGEELGKWGHDNGVCIVALTHTNKYVSGDPLDNVTGSHGVTGSADSVVVLQKEDRFKDKAILSVMCRYAESGQHQIQFEKCRWHNMGVLDTNSKAELERLEHEREYMESDTRIKIAKFLDIVGKWKGRASGLKEDALNQEIAFLDSAKLIGGFLSNKDNRAYLYEIDKIKVSVIDNGTASKMYDLEKLTDEEVLQGMGFEKDTKGEATEAFDHS